MILGGLWHGAAWTFVVWGTLHGGGLAIERYRGERREALGLAPTSSTPGGRALQRLVTFHLVCLGWVFFRSDSFATATTVLGRLVDFGPITHVTPVVLALVAGGIAVQYVPDHARERMRIGFSRLSWVQMATAMGLFLLVLDGFGPTGVAPFIYFQF
jgi:hypothetical protein